MYFWQKWTVKLFIVTVILNIGWELPEGRWLRHVCPSLCLSLSAYTRAVPLNVFPWRLILAAFAQTYPETLNWVKIGAQYRPNYVYIVDSSTTYFVPRQLCRRPLSCVLWEHSTALSSWQLRVCQQRYKGSILWRVHDKMCCENAPTLMFMPCRV